MKTLTVTAARQKLGCWLKRAERGEEIGVVYGASVFVLRKVPIQAADYMETEYGLTREEADCAAARIRAESARDYAAGDCLTLDQFASAVANRRHAQRRGRAHRAA
jgi:antitoxin (DNA-binding transcriptional repressor) of toxin-antitoxin stability system